MRENGAERASVHRLFTLEPLQLSAADLYFHWHFSLKNLLADIVRYLHANGSTCQDPGAPKPSLGLIVYGSQGPCTKPQVDAWGWTCDLNAFLKWLSAVPFTSGEFSEAALADGLYSALKIIAAAKDDNEAQVFGRTHCILVTSHRSLPEHQILDENKVFLHKMDRLLIHATSVASKFVRSFVSLSVISPTQSLRLREIFRVGNVFKPIAECCTDENHNYLILLSDNFVEAHNALSYRDFIIEPAENCTGKEIDFGIYTRFSSKETPPGFGPESLGLRSREVNL